MVVIASCAHENAQTALDFAHDLAIHRHARPRDSLHDRSHLALLAEPAFGADPDPRSNPEFQTQFDPVESRLVRKLLTLSLLGLLASSSADADAFPYVVRSGESLAQIAETMYGRVELERVIVEANGLGGRSRVVSGMRVEVPATAYHRVKPGETWHSVAAARLGGSFRGGVLARLNQAEPWVPPEVGREIVVPYPLRYVANRGDTTQSVAYRLLGRRDEAWVVALYNRLDRAQLRQGEIVLVPLTDLRLTDNGRQAARYAGMLMGAEAGGEARTAQQQAEKSLPVLAEDVRRGRYIAAVQRGAGLLAAGGLSEPQLADVYRLLTEAYVALEAVGLAATTCAAWGKHDSGRELDPIDISPKIMRVCLGDTVQGDTVQGDMPGGPKR